MDKENVFRSLAESSPDGLKPVLCYPIPHACGSLCGSFGLLLLLLARSIIISITISRASLGRTVM